MLTNNQKFIHTNTYKQIINEIGNHKKKINKVIFKKYFDQTINILNETVKKAKKEC